MSTAIRWMVSSQCPITCSSVLGISSATMLPRHSALVAATWRGVTTCHVSRVTCQLTWWPCWRWCWRWWGAPGRTRAAGGEPAASRPNLRRGALLQLLSDEVDPLNILCCCADIKCLYHCGKWYNCSIPWIKRFWCFARPIEYHYKEWKEAYYDHAALCLTAGDSIIAVIRPADSGSCSPTWYLMGWTLNVKIILDWCPLSSRYSRYSP